MVNKDEYYHRRRRHYEASKAGAYAVQCNSDVLLDMGEWLG